MHGIVVSSMQLKNKENQGSILTTEKVSVSWPNFMFQKISADFSCCIPTKMSVNNCQKSTPANYNKKLANKFFYFTKEI